jgi:hypothetical protein
VVPVVVVVVVVVLLRVENALHDVWDRGKLRPLFAFLPTTDPGWRGCRVGVGNVVGQNEHDIAGNDVLNNALNATESFMAAKQLSTAMKKLWESDSSPALTVSEFSPFYSSFQCCDVPCSEGRMLTVEVATVTASYSSL